MHRGFVCMTNAAPYLVLRDEAIGLHGLLPLEEDHVIERGEGQGLWSDAAGNCSRGEKTAFSETNTRLRPQVNGLLHRHQGVKTPLTEWRGTGPGWDGAGQKRGIRDTEQEGGDERELWTGLLSALDELRFWLLLSDNGAPCLGGWQSIFLL